ncbi:MAG: tRNA threonylcarbamoyladenosine dehydratase [Lachnospiraceae bacterium]|nr:tRNA threonylcarbamoyladenosine dehydratase [Lachnospiraceae bacterium]
MSDIVKTEVSAPLTRTQMLLGREAMERLAGAHVAVFGIGGVGGYVCEALVRSGIGAFTLVDSDCVDMTNLNRQIIATRETVGRPKTEVMRERMQSIRPEVRVTLREEFFLPENADTFPFEDYDYVVDAVDTVTAKVEIILRAQAAGVPVISSMGTGNKLDPSRLRLADIYKTESCPLARVMRRELRKRGVTSLTVVYSDEPALTPGAADAEDAPESAAPAEEEGRTRRATPGSTAFVPAAAGLLIASKVVRDIAGR